MSDFLETIGAVFLAILILAVVFLITGAIGLWLWGWIAVGIFGLPALTFWQMYGLIWLAHIIFPSTTVNKKGN